MSNKEYWDKKFKKPFYFGKGINKYSVRSLKFMLKNGVTSCLDIGCGQGQDSIYFVKNGIKITALDFSETAINFLNNTIEKENIKNLLTINHNLLLGIPFTDNSFDSVYSNCSLQFFNENELKEIIKDVYRVLRQKGFFIFTTKKEGDKYYKKGEPVGKNGWNFEGETRYFFPKSFWQKLLTQHGFKIIKFDVDTHLVLSNEPSVCWDIICFKGD